jgi:signal transduction histidine kinase
VPGKKGAKPRLSRLARSRTSPPDAELAAARAALETETARRRQAETDLVEAREQQTATSEILRVIASSPTDVQSVFDAIVRSASRLCGGEYAIVTRYDGDLLHLAAQYNARPGSASATERLFPRRLSREVASARAILERGVVQIPDADKDAELARDAAGIARSFLAVPMVRDGVPIGAIGVSRSTVGPFAPEQIALLQTFAAQAVIAIENVRLFNELQGRNRDLAEALERQTATAEILRVISRSPGDIEPVLNAMVQSAARLCETGDVAILRREGTVLRMVAVTGAYAEMGLQAYNEMEIPATRGSVAGRAILDGTTIHVHDLAQAVEDEYPDAKGLQQRFGHRTMVATPLLREGAAIGAIFVWRYDVRPFSEDQIELLKTFADQAVIAIENVRLFKELEARNAELTETLARQTATGEVLRAISRAQTDAQPVFDIIAASALRLCGAGYGQVQLYDGKLIHLAALQNVDPEGAEAIRRAYPLPVEESNLGGRVILRRTVVQIPDLLNDPGYQYKSTWEMSGLRSLLGVPMLRDGEPIGAIAVGRRDVGPFPQKQIELLQTFAEQAVIAIENVRLFRELQARNHDLTEALERQTATAEILRVISQSQTEVQPVFDAIADNAMRLFRAWAVTVFRVDGQVYRAATARGGLPESGRLMVEHAGWPIDGQTPAGRCMLDRTPIHIADIESDPLRTQVISPGQTVLDFARARGWRSTLQVPMLRDEQPIGAISVARAEPGHFTPPEIDLLKTFADQAVIAVENARLLSELQARTGELTRSVEELTALGDVSQALGSTLDLETVLQTIVRRANELAGTAGCAIWEYDDGRQEFRLRANHYADERDAAVLPVPGGVTVIPKGQGVTTEVIDLRRPVQIPDIAAADAYESPIRRPLLEAGHRALLGVPLLREDEVIGVLAVTRKTPGAFAPEIVRLLTTFATQSALAIQNARLFQEIEDKSRQLEVASRHKSEFLANMSHELRTPLNAIIGFSEVLAEGMFGDVNEKQTEYLQDILESGRHLLSLINDILDLSKIEAGRMELEATDFDLPSAIENALILVRERASRRGIRLDRTIDERLGSIRADERKVKQVLLNLLSNALKFTPEGGRVDVRAGLRDSMAEISVADTGVGIAPEDQEAVFEEFRQVGMAARTVEGTGLGLALSRRFIELHGGKIWVKSDVGVGSTFTFTLPLAIA